MAAGSCEARLAALEWEVASMASMARTRESRLQERMDRYELILRDLLQRQGSPPSRPRACAEGAASPSAQGAVPITPPTSEQGDAPADGNLRQASEARGAGGDPFGLSVMIPDAGHAPGRQPPEEPQITLAIAGACAATEREPEGEKELDILEAPLEFKLQETVWDAALLIGCPQVSAFDSLLVTVLLGVAIFALITFLGITFYVFTEKNIDDDAVERLQEWRINFGHHVKFYDGSSQTSLTERICNPDTFAPEMSSNMAALVANIREYSGNGSVFNGPMLIRVALLLWGLTVAVEISQIWDLFHAVAFLPIARATELSRVGDSGFALTRMSAIRKLWASLMFLWRFSSSVFLWQLGNQFLCEYSISPADILLNAVALEIVLNIDEALFVLVPSRVKMLMERLEPIPAPPIRICRVRLPDLKKYLLLLFVILGVTLQQWLYMDRVVDAVARANATLCAGVQDFVYSHDALNIVYSSPTKFYDSTAGASVLTLSVWETIHPDYARDQEFISATGTQAYTSVTFPAAPLEEVERRKDWDMSQSSTGLQSMHRTVCSDVLGWLPELSRFFKEFIEGLPEDVDTSGLPVISRASKCADVASMCVDWSLARAACPLTCGCAAPVHETLRASTQLGCPSACAASTGYFNALAATPCSEKSPTQLRTDPVWASWAKQFDEEAQASLHTGLRPCVDCEEWFLSLGCGFIPVWTAHFAHLFGIRVDPCTGQWLNDWLILRPMAPYCPATCGCQAAAAANATVSELLARGCPGGCAA